MSTIDASDKKLAIIDATWRYLLRTGLAKASVGDLCKETKIAQSSLYYWFKDKDDIWISAGKYGMSKVVDALLGFTFDHISNTSEYFQTLLSEVEKYKYELRVGVQITTSPVFGGRMREKAMDFRAGYEAYGKKLVEIFGCTHLQAETFIYSIIAFVIDYAIWDDGEKTQMLLDNLYERTKEVLSLQASV